MIILDHLSACSPVIPTHVTGIIVLLMFMLAMFVHGRQEEWAHRLDFLWKTQVRLKIEQPGK